MFWQKKLFWDIELSTLDTEKHAGFIIERVLQRGDINDWNKLKKDYGVDRLRTEAVKIRNFDPKTMMFLSAVLEIPKEQFKCYSKTLLKQKHMNY